MYRQLSEDYRHHLRWREKLFGGFLVLVGALAVAFYYTHYTHASTAKQPLPFGWVIPLVGAALSCVFFLFERRVQNVLRDRRDVGRAFEQRAMCGGLFDSIRRTGLDAGWFSHSRVLSFLYGVTAVLFLAIFIWDARRLGLLGQLFSAICNAL
jgi:hypothetical protein